MRRAAVLISGGGSNFQALIDAAASRRIDVEIALLICNEPGAFGLERARRAGIPSVVLDHRAFDGRAAHDAAIDRCLREHAIDLVCLAGFMRILGPRLVEGWRGRMLNIHPSLLPAFKGLNTHQRTLEAGVRVHGCTVHHVTPELDDGPILVQGVVPVLDTDDAASLAARVLEMEHLCYPQAVAALDSVDAVDRLLIHPLLGGKTRPPA